MKALRIIATVMCAAAFFAVGIWVGLTENDPFDARYYTAMGASLVLMAAIVLLTWDFPRQNAA